MPRQIVIVKSRRLITSPDVALSRTRRVWGVVVGRLTDELTGRPITQGVTVWTDATALSGRATPEGIFGLEGVPVAAFPRLNLVPYDVNLRVDVEGYVRFQRVVHFGTQADFPDNFTPVRLGDVVLHRQPIQIRGRVIRMLPTGSVPANGATVTITRQARTIQAAAPTLPPPHLFSARPPLAFDHAAGTAEAHRREVTLIAGEDKRLLEYAPAGATEILLSDRFNLSPLTAPPSELLVLDPLNSERSEHIAIAALSGSAADEPARIMLASPLAYPHAAGTLARRATLQPAGAANLFDVDAVSGDASLYLASRNDLSPAQMIEILDPAHPPEYRQLLPLTATCNADGYYRLPLLSRAAQVQIEAALLAATHSQTFIPDYSTFENRLDFILR